MSDLATMAANLGVNLDAPTEYRLADDGRPIYPNGHRPLCPFGCGDPHRGDHGQPGEGSSCPWRRVPLAECYPDPTWRRLKAGGVL